jgi:hypothetical protein
MKRSIVVSNIWFQDCANKGSLEEKLKHQEGIGSFFEAHPALEK